MHSRTNKGAGIADLHLAEAAREFHRAQGLLTAKVEQSLARLTNGALIVRFAYQPNFLPDANQFAQLIYLADLENSLLEEGVMTVGVVLLVDHDVAGNTRFRRSDVWDPSVGGHVRSFELPIPEAQWDRVISSFLEPGDIFRASLGQQQS